MGHSDPLASLIIKCKLNTADENYELDVGALDCVADDVGDREAGETLESHFDEAAEDDGDSGDDIDAENCFYNNDQDHVQLMKIPLNRQTMKLTSQKCKEETRSGMVVRTL
ncbi:Hypothetical predicted protein [Paramuricea clavata]|uniref:Uncharacterized protein n=1 Tax=Paramuricea clavata TaxID=317549 RepID=A0A7D9HVB1_PARCT|nr:Hypothetical predicted protein [Paramuricea clavata]